MFDSLEVEALDNSRIWIRYADGSEGEVDVSHLAGHGVFKLWEDEEIFQAARRAGVLIMTKDGNFLNLLDRYGPPPNVIWVTCGNTSNQRMRTILKQTLQPAVEMLKESETVVEIGDL